MHDYKANLGLLDGSQDQPSHSACLSRGDHVSHVDIRHFLGFKDQINVSNKKNL